MGLTDKAGADTGIHLIYTEDFEQIVMQHQKRIYRVLIYLVQDADVAEVLTQECFLRAFRKRSSFSGEASPEAWLMSIAMNLAHDHNGNRRWAFWRRLTRTDRLEAMHVLDA